MEMFEGFTDAECVFYGVWMLLTAASFVYFSGVGLDELKVVQDAYLNKSGLTKQYLEEEAAQRLLAADPHIELSNSNFFDNPQLLGFDDGLNNLVDPNIVQIRGMDISSDILFVNSDLLYGYPLMIFTWGVYASSAYLYLAGIKYWTGIIFEPRHLVTGDPDFKVWLKLVSIGFPFILIWSFVVSRMYWPYPYSEVLWIGLV